MFDVLFSANSVYSLVLVTLIVPPVEFAFHISLWLLDVPPSYFIQSNTAYISDRIIQWIILQKTYEVYDCLFYDDGVTSPKTVTWYNQDSVFTLTPGSDGTLVESSTTQFKKLFADGTTYSNSSKWLPNTCVEVEIVSSTSGTDNQLYIGSNVNPSITFNGACTLKMTWDGSKVDKYIDGVYQSTTNNVTSDKIAIGFNLKGGTFKFKDFKIYPI